MQALKYTMENYQENSILYEPTSAVIKLMFDMRNCYNDWVNKNYVCVESVFITEKPIPSFFKTVTLQIQSWLLHSLMVEWTSMADLGLPHECMINPSILLIEDGLLQDLQNFLFGNTTFTLTDVEKFIQERNGSVNQYLDEETGNASYTDI